MSKKKAETTTEEENNPAVNPPEETAETSETAAEEPVAEEIADAGNSEVEALRAELESARSRAAQLETENADLQKVVEGYQEGFEQQVNEIKALENVLQEKSKIFIGENEAGLVRVLVAGSHLQMADEQVTFVTDAAIVFPNSHSEPKFAAMLAMTDNLTPENRAGLKYKYDGLGHVLPLAEQVERQKDIPAFVAGLSREEANIFGCVNTWEEIKAEEARRAEEDEE